MPREKDEDLPRQLRVEEFDERGLFGGPGLPSLTALIAKQPQGVPLKFAFKALARPVLRSVRSAVETCGDKAHPISVRVHE